MYKEKILCFGKHIYFAAADLYLASTFWLDYDENQLYPEICWVPQESQSGSEISSELLEKLWCLKLQSYITSSWPSLLRDFPETYLEGRLVFLIDDILWLNHSAHIYLAILCALCFRPEPDLKSLKSSRPGRHYTIKNWVKLPRRTRLFSTAWYPIPKEQLFEK